MSERLLSVGLDIGTTTSQMILSELTVENRASGFAVPEMEIAERKILYQSTVHITPLLGDNLVDGEGIRELVEAEYRRAGITREAVDTGAIIITGETSRKENARTVLDALSEFAGNFVVATAGPDLESVLAAKGAGAVAQSRHTGKTILHMDIGGGTSNLALIREGHVVETGCLNVGGRLLRFDSRGTVTYVSPVLSGLCSLRVGALADRKQVEQVARLLTDGLEMAAGLRERTELLDRLWTEESGAPWVCDEPVVLSFSGGVADCIRQDIPWLSYGDMGPVLGQSIRESRLCRGPYSLGTQTIRATVIGAGCHSTQLSGSTVFLQNMPLPIKNIPVVPLNGKQQEKLSQVLPGLLARQEGLCAIALPGWASPAYSQVTALAEQLLACGVQPLVLCLEQDMAKALGQALALRLGREARILCLDRVPIPESSYLDVGTPVGPALPVVVKTLILQH